MVGVVVGAGRVVVTGGTVMGGAVVVTGGVVTGVVGGTVVGTSVIVTPGLGTVVAGAGGVDERTGGAEVTVVATAMVLVVVEVEGSTAAKRLPSSVVEVVVTAGARVRLGLFVIPRGLVLAASPDVAAMTRATEMVPTTAASTMLFRVFLLWANHHSRSRSCACGRPKAAFLPMNEGKG